LSRNPSAVWKAVVAWSMKSRTDASNGWLASALNLGSSTYVSKQAGLVRDGRLGTLATRFAKRLISKDPVDWSAQDNAEVAAELAEEVTKDVMVTKDVIA